MQETEDSQQMLNYLLRDLDEVEQDRIEERYFLDDEFHTKLLVAEDELIDSYVLDELSRDERARFELAYLSDARGREKVEANRNLLSVIRPPTPPPVPAPRRLLAHLTRALTGRGAGLRLSLAGLLLLLGVAGVFSAWLLLDRARAGRELEQARAQLREQEANRQRELAGLRQTPTPAPAAPAPSPGSRPGRPDETEANGGGQQERVTTSARQAASRANGLAAPPIVSFALTPGGVRSLRGGTRVGGPLLIPRGAVLVRLSVRLEENEHTSYRATLQEVGGQEVWSGSVSGGRPGVPARQVKIELPASRLPSGDYLLRVTGPGTQAEDETLALHYLSVVNRGRGRQEAGASQR